MSHVYVISGRYQKIGFSAKPQDRLSALKTASPYDLTLSWSQACEFPEKVERRAHEKLGEQRLSGEWFDVTQERAVNALREAIAEISAENASAIRRTLLTLKLVEDSASGHPSYIVEADFDVRDGLKIKALLLDAALNFPAARLCWQGAEMAVEAIDDDDGRSPVMSLDDEDGAL